MRIRMLLAGVVGGILGVMVTLGSTVTAQRGSRVPGVTTPNGFVVEEVRVGDSCVVVATRGAGGSVAAVPCTGPGTPVR